MTGRTRVRKRSEGGHTGRENVHFEMLRVWRKPSLERGSLT